ncbi:hypothetical protein N431DRAFT_491429 [Stipitochalara longipes BDJ]|nr:hypothetical protein N431DRAFT_491429 [Stipitochalara longipes BDJ]
MRFCIQSCGPADAPDIATNLIDRSTKRFPWNLINKRELKRYQKAIDVASGEVVGYARWLLPPELADEKVWSEAQVGEPSPKDRELFERDFQESSLPNSKSGEMIAFRAGGLEEAAKRIFDVYVVVDFLTVKPAFQRQGVASLLVKSGCEIADAYHLKAYVIASPAGLKAYKGQGFNVVEIVSTDYSQFGAVEQYIHHFLVRQPVSPEPQAPSSIQ